MNNGFKANPEGVRINGQKVISEAENLFDELSNLENNVNSLMGIWKGEAANSFKASFDEYQTLFKNFQLTLNDLGEATVKSSQIFQDAEAENARIASDL